MSILRICRLKDTAWPRIKNPLPNKGVTVMSDGIRDAEGKRPKWMEKDENAPHGCIDTTPGSCDSDEQKPPIVWQCPHCQHVNTDSRKSYVICVECGEAYDKAPKGQIIPLVPDAVPDSGQPIPAVGDRGTLAQEWENRAEMIVRGTQDSSSGWYNSPDDLVAVIAAELNAAFIIGKKSIIATPESE